MKIWKAIETCVVLWIVFLTQCQVILQWDPNTDQCYNLNSNETINLYDCKVTTDAKKLLHAVCDMFCPLDYETNLPGEPSYLIISWGLRSDRTLFNTSDPICLWLSNITLIKTNSSIVQRGTEFRLEEEFKKSLNLFASGRVNILFQANQSRMVGVAKRDGNCDVTSSDFSVSAIDDNANTSCKLNIAGITDMVDTEERFNKTDSIIEMIDKLNYVYRIFNATFALLRVQFFNNSQFEKLFLILFSTNLKVVRLEMIDTNFDSLSNFDLMSFPYLKELSFSRGVIETIEDKALDHLPNLNVLDVSFNAFPTIPDQIYGDNLKMLTKLNMNGNVPKGKGKSFFLTPHEKRNPHLLLLTLSETPIEQIKSRSFSSFPHLIQLCLDRCGINNIHAGAFDDLSYLAILDLAANNISSLPPELFANLVSLKFLNLSMNKITTSAVQEMHSFYASRRPFLKSSNHEASIQNLASFSSNNVQNTLLKHLDLSNNLITVISLEMQFNLQNVKRVNISINLFDCSPCPLYLAHVWLNKSSAENPNLFFCSTPSSLKGKAIMKLKSDANSCTKSDSAAIALYCILACCIILACLVLVFRNTILSFIKRATCKKLPIICADTQYDSL